jgi:arginyl-tRNA synthetase
LKTLIDTLLRQALASLPETLVPAAARNLDIEIERTRDAQHGDFASNIAMRLAKAARQNPRKIAEALLTAMPASVLSDAAIAKVEIAGAGFINFFLKDDAYHAELGRVLMQGTDYGKSTVGGGRSVLVEFVSANPTGPLHVGHGRHAAFGATVANLLETVGYRVAREYYINDAGRQMEILAASTWLRYLERCGERFTLRFRRTAIAAITSSPSLTGCMPQRAARCATAPWKCSKTYRPTSPKAAIKTFISMPSSFVRDS